MRDPRDKQVDHGRGFDIYDNLMWEQRVDKEERAILQQDQVKSCSKRMRNKQDDDIRRLEQKVLGREKDSLTSLMYSSNGLPDKYRALNRWPVTETCMITCHPKKHDEDGLVPKLRFNSGYVDAMWVPGKTGKCGKILQHRPEFYLEDSRCSNARERARDDSLKAWEMPAAGAKPPPRARHGASASSVPPAAEPAEGCRAGRAASPEALLGCSASRANFMPASAAAPSGMAVVPNVAGSTLEGGRANSSIQGFQIGAPVVPGTRQAKPKSLARRSRSSTLVSAGDSAMPRPRRPQRPLTPGARGCVGSETWTHSIF